MLSMVAGTRDPQSPLKLNPKQQPHMKKLHLRVVNRAQGHLCNRYSLVIGIRLWAVLLWGLSCLEEENEEEEVWKEKLVAQ